MIHVQQLGHYLAVKFTKYGFLNEKCFSNSADDIPTMNVIIRGTKCTFGIWIVANIGWKYWHVPGMLWSCVLLLKLVQGIWEHCLHHCREKECTPQVHMCIHTCTYAVLYINMHLSWKRWNIDDCCYSAVVILHNKLDTRVSLTTYFVVISRILHINIPNLIEV